MANNPYVNKVQFGGQTIMDISDTDAEESDVAEGKIFYKGTGQRSVGTGSGGGGSSIQVEVLPEASIDELGKIYQYIGNHSIDVEYTDDTSNFVGEGNGSNYSIAKNDLQLRSINGGYGMIKCKTPLINRGTLKITHRGNTGAASYAGMYLGSTMGGSDIYTSPSWNTSATAVTDEIDLSQFDNEEIYVSFRINVASGNRGFWYITSMHHEAEDIHTKGYFYKCVSDGESTPTYSWEESPTFFVEGDMPSEDMAEVASPMPSVMSRRFKYSTEEQVVGEWIDGKPIYQKTFDLGVDTEINNTSWTNVGISGTNISNVVLANSVSNTDSRYFSLNAAKINGVLQFLAARANGAIEIRYITLQYTKTTD